MKNKTKNKIFLTAGGIAASLILIFAASNQTILIKESAAEARIESLKTEINKFEKIKEKAESDKILTVAELEKQKKIVSDIVSEKNIYNDQLKSINEEIVVKKEELADIRKRIVNMEDSRKKMTKEIASLEKDKENMENKFKSAEIKLNNITDLVDLNEVQTKSEESVKNKEVAKNSEEIQRSKVVKETPRQTREYIIQ